MTAQLVHSGARLCSVTDLAADLDLDRRTVTKYISEIPHVEKRGRSKLWRLRDVLPALAPLVLPAGASGDPESLFDPERMLPADRDKWFSSEQRRIKLLAEARDLLQRHEVEAGIAETLKAMQQTISTLPDVAERDAQLSPKQVEILIAVCDRTLEQLHKSLLEVAAGLDD